MENLGKPDRSEYRFGDVVVDCDNYRVRKGGRIGTLTPRAFDVLLFLIENRGRVVGKQELFEAIWKETFVTDNALMRAIKEIRRELGDNANSPRYIETVHKRGYRFIAELEGCDEVDVASDLSAIEGEGFIDQVPNIPRSADAIDSERNKPRELPRKSNHRFKIVTIVGLPVVVAAVLFVLWSAPVTPRKITSIAVLPFANESGNPDLEYLSDGMTETLIGSLSQLPDLNIKARSTVFRYKGKDISASNIGNELKVQAVLTGRVVQRGDELAVYLSLVDAASENNLWSKQYNRKPANLFSLQGEIARDVATSLGAKLYGIDEQRVTKSNTENLEAYHLYLRGRYHVLTTRNLGAETGVSYFRQAIALDPNFALAYAGLAEASIGLAFGSEIAPDQVFKDARSYASKAVELDEQLSEGHVALGFVQMWYDWDWRSAENHLMRALAINPNNADAHLAYGILLCNLGRQEAGLSELRRSIELDPLNLRNSAVEAQYLTFAGQPDEALAGLRRSLEMEPNFYLAYPMAANAYIEKEMFAEAIAEARAAQSRNPIASFPVALEGYALAKSGKTTDARRLLDELLKRSEKRYVTTQSIALIYNGLGEYEQALNWLERGIEYRDLRMTFLKVDSKWSNLRAESRFIEIMHKVGLAD